MIRFASVVALLAMSASLAHADLSLVWSDEFSGSTLDTDFWTHDIGDGCPDLCGWGNNELQYYRAENVSLGGGYLTITAQDQWYGGRAFTSGKIHTRGKLDFLYGRMEMRAKVPGGGGLWPAFWMMPADDAYGGWAASGEIDIMETANDADFINGTIHYGGQWPENTYSHSTYSPGLDFSEDFHVYAVEWEEDEIRWYVDDVLFGTRTSSQWYSSGAPGNPRAPFDQPFYLILNLAVGGNYTGCTSNVCISADLPCEYIVDYVRVYQDTGNEAPTVAITSPPSGAVLPAGNVVITAEANDTDGAVLGVEFYHGDTFIGLSLDAPYTTVWSDVPDGCYLIEARVLDDAGGTASDVVDVTVGSGCGQGPFGGVAVTLPGVVEAEDFDLGGAGVAYHDVDAGNSGGQYRTDENVDIEVCTDTGGGYNVGWLRQTEWLEYTVDVPVAGEYPIDVRVASLDQGGSFRLELGGEDLTGPVTVPVTGGWQTWTTVETAATLPVGQVVLRFVLLEEGFNLNSLTFGEPTLVAAPDLAAARPTLHACYPNPFNPSTTLAYSLPAASAVRLSVFDVSGRLVRVLVNEAVQTAGRHEVVWRGDDARGRQVASGTYYGRLEAGAVVQMRAMSLLK